MLKFADSFEQKIANTWFKKDVQKLVIHELGGHEPVIDYILMKKEKMKNATAIPGKETMLQHHLIVINILFRKACCEHNVKVKIWKLKKYSKGFVK